MTDTTQAAGPRRNEQPSSIRSVRRYALWFLIVSGLLLVLRQGVGEFVGDGTNGMAFAVNAIDMVLLVVSLGFTLFLILLLYWLLGQAIWWIGEAILKAPSIAETKPVHRLFGVLAVGVFFSGLIQSLFDVGRRLVIGLFSDVPTDMMTSFRHGLGCIESGGPGERLDSSCVAGFFSDAGQTIQRAAIGIFGNDGLGQIPPVQFIGALVVFAIVAIGLRWLLALGGSDDTAQARAQFWMVYGCLAAFATYLTLSAILAVPLLSEDRAESPRPADELRTVLVAMMPTTSDTPAQPSIEWARPPVTIAANEPAAGSGAPPADAWSIQTSYVDALVRDLDVELSVLDSRKVQLDQVSDQALRNSLEMAVIAYDSEIRVRRGQREANRHFQDLQVWFQRRVGDTRKQSARCTTALAAADARLRRMRDLVRRAQSAGPEQKVQSRLSYTESLSFMASEEERRMRELLYRAENDCAEDYGRSDVPPSRRDYGSYLGVVGLAASWLLGTEKMEVVLITGLVGFGLLGALVAQFVESRGEQRLDVARIATVVFSGFVAAIVVYVAAYGGLAIASVEGNDPNPYVVFGACLVGAVFSAEIWARAKNWFLTERTPTPAPPPTGNDG